MPVTWSAGGQGLQHHLDDRSGAVPEGAVQVAVQLGGGGLQPALFSGRRLLVRQVALVGTDPHTWPDQQQALEQVGALAGDAAHPAAGAGRSSDAVP